MLYLYRYLCARDVLPEVGDTVQLIRRMAPLKLVVASLALLLPPSHAFSAIDKLEDFEMMLKQWTAVEQQLDGGCKKPGDCGIGYQGKTHSNSNSLSWPSFRLTRAQMWCETN